MTITEIQARIERLKKGYRPSEHEVALKALFQRLKNAHDWCEKQTSFKQLDKGLLKVEGIYEELEKLGVEKSFSAALFIFGGVILDRDMLAQFLKPSVLPQTPVSS